ncbi:MAG TPA: aminopeptidase [Gammaproteobacteria bacterium]
MLRFERMFTPYRLAGLLAACAAMATAVSGCALPFYWQAVGGQLELLRKRTPIDRLLADPNLDPELRAQLESVAEIRTFAVEALGLPDNDSYTTYADLGRPYVVWNVVATEEFSVQPVRWCFPIAGCVAYRGFFEREKAERFRARLERRGYDTYAGGASAYSTLGYFDDPVLNTMIGGGPVNVASLLFHELAHQRLYVKSDSAFSEAFATVVEEYGTELWLRERGDLDGLEQYKRRLRHRADFADLVTRQQARLQEIYASDLTDEQKREAKRLAFEKMREEYAALKQEWGGATDYDAWFAQPLNNATLASVATYRRWLPGLRWQLEEQGLMAFYASAEQLAELSPEERGQRLESWLAQASAPGVLSQAR